MENVKNDAICHVTRQNQYNPAGGGATTRVLGGPTRSSVSTNSVLEEP